MALGPLLAMLGVGAFLYYMESQSPQGLAPGLDGKAAFVAELSGIVSSIVGPLGWGSGVVAIIVAWAAMESNWGASQLATQANNLFGIKAGPTWQGEGKAFISLTTHEYQDTPQATTVVADFRSYGSWTESVQDLLNLIKITTIYKPAYDALARGDIQGFLQAIDASGYSTAKNYAARIVGALGTIRGLS